MGLKRHLNSGLWGTVWQVSLIFYIVEGILFLVLGFWLFYLEFDRNYHYTIQVTVNPFTGDLSDIRYPSRLGLITSVNFSMETQYNAVKSKLGATSYWIGLDSIGRSGNEWEYSSTGEPKVVWFQL